MYLCDDGHTEIVFSGLKCPMCILTDEVENLTKENSRLIDKCDDLSDEIAELKTQEE